EAWTYAVGRVSITNRERRSRPGLRRPLRPHPASDREPARSWPGPGHRRGRAIPHLAERRLQAPQGARAGGALAATSGGPRAPPRAPRSAAARGRPLDLALRAVLEREAGCAGRIPG